MALSLHYFLSSLPLLRWGEQPPFTHQRFLADCHDLLAPEQAEAVQALSLDPLSATPSPLKTGRMWHDAETIIRNAAAQARAAKLGRPAPTPRETSSWDQALHKLVQDAFAAGLSPQEREARLDLARWQTLDNWEAESAFTVEAVAIYALKLQLLERIASRRPDNESFNALIEYGAEQAENNRIEH